MSTRYAEAHHEPALPLGVKALTKRFEGRLPGDEVLAAVEQAHGEIEPDATVPDFLDLLVERRARDILTARSRKATGRLGLV